MLHLSSALELILTETTFKQREILHIAIYDNIIELADLSFTRVKFLAIVLLDIGY